MGLFLLMLRVPAETAQRAIELKNLLARDYCLRGFAYEAERLHITLFNLGSEMSRERVAYIERSAPSVATSCFEVQFNRVMSWPDALVLVGEEKPGALTAFRRELGAVLGLRRSGFTPHITLMRGATTVEEQQVQSLRWTVRDFVLVHSADRRHVELGRWPLAATPPEGPG